MLGIVVREHERHSVWGGRLRAARGGPIPEGAGQGGSSSSKRRKTASGSSADPEEDGGGESTGCAALEEDSGRTEGEFGGGTTHISALATCLQVTHLSLEKRISLLLVLCVRLN